MKPIFREKISIQSNVNSTKQMTSKAASYGNSRDREPDMRFLHLELKIQFIIHVFRLTFTIDLFSNKKRSVLNKRCQDRTVSGRTRRFFTTELTFSAFFCLHVPESGGSIRSGRTKVENPRNARRIQLSDKFEQ